VKTNHTLGMNLSVVTSLFVDGTRGTRLKTMRVYGIHV